MNRIIILLIILSISLFAQHSSYVSQKGHLKISGSPDSVTITAPTHIKQTLQIDSVVTFNVGTNGLTLQTGIEWGVPHWWFFDTNNGYLAFANNGNVFMNFGANGFQIRSNMSFLDNTEAMFGNDNDFRVEYDVASNQFRIQDKDANSMVTLEDAGTTGNFTVTGNATAAQFFLSAMNTSPASSTDSGTTGEIRVTATHIYVCTAPNTWVRAALSSW